MRLHRRLIGIIIGIALIVLGLYLSIEFILQFAKAAIGLILIIIGMSFLTSRW